MIKTSQYPVHDILPQIPAGKTVGILGCGNCAAVQGTGGTKQVEAWSAVIAKNNPVVFSAVMEAPCDQRVVQRFMKAVLDFRTAEVILFLGCPAGGQCLADFLKKNHSPQKLILGLKIEGIGWISLENKKWEHCLICPDCHFEPQKGKCPVASCPLMKTDGPCQNRGPKDACSLATDQSCVWITT